MTFDLRAALGPVWRGEAYYASRPWAPPAVVDPDGRKRDMGSDAEARRWADERRDVLAWLPEGATVYDLGCGDGKLKVARPDLTVWGYDPDPQQQQAAVMRGVRAAWIFDADKLPRSRREEPDEPTPPDLAALGEPPVDALWCCHVVEHMADPLADLHAGLGLVRSGGAVVVETPDFGSPVALEWGDRFRLLHDPTHVSLFTAESLVRMLRALGVVVEEVAFPGWFGSPLSKRRNELHRSGAAWSPPAPGNVVAVRGTKR